MPDALDDLARQWKDRPDAAGAITLCDALRRSAPASRRSLVDEVAKLATERFAADGRVLLAVARLYVAAERLSDAQGVLVSAGRVAPREAGVFGLLGEVLLRRGDAERAEKVLQRAIQLGAKDSDTLGWMQKAKALLPMQAKAGARAVAVEIKSTSVHPLTPHPGMLQPARPPADTIDQDAMTVVRSSPLDAEEKTAVRAPPPGPRAGSLSMPTEATVQRGVLSFPRDIPPDAPLDVPSGAVPLPTGPMKAQDTGGGARPVAAAPPAPTRPPTPFPEDPADGGVFEDKTDIRAPDLRALAPLAAAAPAARPAPFVAPAPTAAPATAPARIPAARDVLSALANAGVFEPRDVGAGPVQWDRPKEKVQRRTAIGLGVGIVVFVLGAVGVLTEVQRRRARAHDEAEAALAKVEADLSASKAALLPEIERTIGRAFELDSRSPRAAADWLEERALKGLLQGGAELAFEDAVTRATEVKVADDKIAFARVSAFLFQGDTGGAAGLLPKWDGPAANDALYQLVTGATLERAGDPHATERYQAAAKLAPKLVLAELLLTRATAFDGDPSKAAELAKQFRAKYPDRPEGAALVGLAWARDPLRGEQAPPEVADAIAHAADLPVPLLGVPYALQAVLALDKHSIPDATVAIEKGLRVANDPGMATWLGTIALDTRDEPLVRKAALLAVTFSAVYAPARVLAGRIALLGGRLDEALKATEDLDPTSPDVAIVRAAAAYERVDADAMGRALEALPADAKKLPVFETLGVAPDVLFGREAERWPAADAPAKLLELSRDDAPWSDLVGMDAVLDLGLTDVADKILADWKGTEDRPLKALRASRLARYENRLDDADHSSKAALEGATVTPRVLMERVMVLVAKNRTADVGPLLARYPLVLGPASSWLSAYALASNGKLDDARGRTAQLDVPPALAPLPFRVMAAVSLAAMKDKKRAEPAIKALLATGNLDPDVLAAAASIGIKTAAAPAKPKK